MRVILFAFWGRQANVELQLPYIRRILDENPDVEFHGWDLARDRDDSRYLRRLTSDRITIRTEHYPRDGRASRGQVLVWKHYTHPDYRDCLFVKLDDDDVFIDTNRFGDFVQAAHDNPDHVISALTINNGASTRHIPELWDMYETLGIPLLDVHLSAEYAEQSHRWFFDNWPTLTTGHGELVDTDDWVSINAIAYPWQMGRAIAQQLGKRSPEHIAGRDFPYRRPDGRLVQHRIGDEGATNMQPRKIHTGFVVGHLNFGPQIQSDKHPNGMPPELLDELRAGYDKVAQVFLA